jgi:RHS repeat-associated protein
LLRHIKCVEMQVHFRPVAIGCERLLVSQFRFGRGFVSIAVSLSVVTAGLAASAVRAQTTPTESSSTSSSTSSTTSTTVPGGGSTTSSATTSTTASTTSTTTSSTTPPGTTTTSTTSTTVAGAAKAGRAVAAAAPAGSVPLAGAPQCSWANAAGTTPWGAYGWISAGQSLVQTDVEPCVLDPNGVLRFKVGTNRAGAFAFGETCTGDNNTGPPRPLYFTATLGASVGTFAVAVWCVSAASDAQMNVGLVGPGLPTVRVGAWDFPVRKLTVAAVGTPLKITTAQTVEIDFSAADESVSLRSGAVSVAVPEMANRFPSGVGAGISIQPTPAPVFQAETFISGATIEGTTFVSPAPAQPATRVMGVSYSKGSDQVLKAVPASILDPVNSATGAFDHSLTDMSLPGRGEELSFGRNYDSRQTASSTLGKGWWHPYFQSVAVNAAGVLSWTTGTGSMIDFAPNGSGGFSVPPGVLAEASVVAGGGWKVLTNAQTTYTFNAAGRLVGVVDRSGQGVSVAYDAAVPLRVSVISNGSGKTLTLTYGTGSAATGGVAGTGRLVQVKGSDLRTVKYAYTGASGTSLLSSVTDVRGKVWSYAYDGNGFLEKETDPNINVQFTNTFDVAGRVVSQKDQLNNVSSFAYNDTAGTTTLTDAAGAVRVWNRLGNVPNGATDPAGSVSTEFNAQLDAVSFTDATLHKWTATYDARGNMLSRTAPAPLSYSESWTYDGFNNPLTYVDARGNTTTYGYDPSGRLLSEARPGGVTLGYTWNSDGTLATSTDPRGGVTTYAYDANGWLLSQVTPLGFKTSYTYDAAGRVLTITEPRGNVVGATVTNFQQKFTYDADGNVLTERDALNRTTTHVYDNGGRRSQSTAPDGGITRFEYNAANELVKQIAPDGGVTDYEYDNRGLRTKETSPIGAITTFQYDAAGRLEWRVDPRGNEPGATANDFKWSFTYDAAGRQRTVTDPLGRVTTTNYDQLGRVLSTVRPDGATSQVYDQNGNVTSTTTEAGTVSQVFDPLNRVESSTDLRGKTTSFAYDLAGNRTRVTDPLTRVTTYVFDADGRMSSMVDARGNAVGANPADFTTSFLYDEAGNQIQVTDPLGLITKQVYDRVGNVTTSTNAKNLNTTFVFDTMNRTTRVTAPVVGATNYSYTNMGYVATRTDPLSTATVPRVSSWLYDLAGRTTEKKDAAGRRFTFGYDIRSNQTTIVDANANAAGNAALGTTTMTFDRLNRLTQRSYSDGTPTVTYAYYPNGRLRAMDDGVGFTAYIYDPAGRVTQSIGENDSRLRQYTYDAAGNVLTRNLNFVNYSATYDDAGQVATVTDPTGSYVMGYDPIGNLTQVTYPGGVTQARAYDRAARLAGVVNTGPTGPIGGFAYTRDANGNPTAVDVSGPAGVITTESMRHTYDNADRLTKTCFTTAATCTAANQSTWSYDKVGNRLTEKVGSAAVSTYTYDVADQLTAIAGPGAMSFTYNANGDQLTAGPDVFAYNTARQTTSATVGGVQTTFTYLGDGTRHRRTTAGVVTTEEYDSMGGLGQVVSESSPAGGRNYIYAPGGMLLGTTSNSVYGAMLTDGLGSVTNITTASGAVGATYRYNPYGTTRAATSVLPDFTSNTMRYTGQQLDPTGNYNLRARHYNPGRGAFTQTDPMPYGAGTAYESSYVYGGARPTVMTDPGGMRFSNSLSMDRNKGPKKPNPDCSSCQYTVGALPNFDYSSDADWNTQPRTRSDSLMWSGWYAKAVGANNVRGDYVAGSFFLQHYLRGTGAALDWSPEVIGRAGNDQRKSYNAIFGALEDNLSSPNARPIRDAQEAFNRASGQNSFDSGWFGVSSYADSKQGLPGLTGGLQAALGGFSIKVVGTRSPSGKWCGRLVLTDRYNFTYDPQYPNGINSQMARLNQVGLARAYNWVASIDLSTNR